MQEPPKEPVKYVDANVYLPYHYIAGDYRARFFAAMRKKKFLGSKCDKTGEVFVSPLVNSPQSFAPCTELVELDGRGVITTFCITAAVSTRRDFAFWLRGAARHRRCEPRA